MDRKTSLSNILHEAAEEISYELGYWGQSTLEEEKIIQSVKKILHDIMEIQKTL